MQDIFQSSTSPPATPLPPTLFLTALFPFDGKLDGWLVRRVVFLRKGCSELLTATAIRKGSLDNTSAMVVDLRGLWAEDASATAAVGAGTTGVSRKQELRASSSYSPSKAPAALGGRSSSHGGGGGDSDTDNSTATRVATTASVSSRPSPSSGSGLVRTSHGLSQRFWQ